MYNARFLAYVVVVMFMINSPTFAQSSIQLVENGQPHPDLSRRGCQSEEGFLLARDYYSVKWIQAISGQKLSMKMKLNFDDHEGKTTISIGDNALDITTSVTGEMAVSRTMALAGPSIKTGTSKGSANISIKPNVDFELVVRYANERLSFVIDGKTVYSEEAVVPPTGIMNLRGYGTHVRIYEFTAHGEFIPPDDVLDLSHVRDKILADKHRPTYHFVMPEGIAEPFDPNGAIYWNGRYHLFYIFQPRLADIYDSYWGHVSSKDLVHWRFHPTALAPSSDGSDHGIFSGNAFVNKDGEATIIYHGVGTGNSIATSSDPDLNTWKKLASNPIVPQLKKDDPDYGKYSSWDPHGWLDGDTYYSIFGGGTATLFRSDNLEDWEFIGSFLNNNLPEVEEFEDISCPDFFKFGDQYMLMCISHSIGARYYLGEFKDNKFYPGKHARMNWGGGACFANESMLDPQGRRIMWAWAIDSRFHWDNHREIVQNVGWSGTMTLPRVFSLDDAGEVLIMPIEELQILRSNHQMQNEISVAADSETRLANISGDCLELDMTIEPGQSQRFGIKVRSTDDGVEETAIFYDVANQQVIIDFEKSTLDTSITYYNYIFREEGRKEITSQIAPFTTTPGKAVNFRVFLDRSMLEVFVNDKICLTQRIYPTRDDATGVALFTDGGAIKVKELHAWRMEPSNPW